MDPVKEKTMRRSSLMKRMTPTTRVMRTTRRRRKTRSMENLRRALLYALGPAASGANTDQWAAASRTEVTDTNASNMFQPRSRDRSLFKELTFFLLLGFNFR